MGMVELGTVDSEEEVKELREMITAHLQHTGSGIAEKVLDNWRTALSQFVKVLPVDYKRYLEEQREKETIEAAIKQCNGNIPKAANLLEISASTLYRKVQKWETQEN